MTFENVKGGVSCEDCDDPRHHFKDPSTKVGGQACSKVTDHIETMEFDKFGNETDGEFGSDRMTFLKGCDNDLA